MTLTRIVSLTCRGLGPNNARHKAASKEEIEKEEEKERPRN
jgi:hypothetical protein